MSDLWQPGGPEPRRGGFISRQSFTKQQVRIIHAEGTLEQTVQEEVAHVRAGTGFFDLEARLREGDVVELSEPAEDGVRRLRVERVVVRDSGPRLMRHVQVALGPAPDAPSPTGEVDGAAAVRVALASVDARVAALAVVDDALARELLELAGRMHSRLDAADGD
jgi:hypothetical protein